MIKTFFALVVITIIAAFAAIIFSLDAISHSRDEQTKNTATTTTPAATTAATHDHSSMSQATGSGTLTSFAGAKPDNADELAAAHKPFPAELPAVPAGNVVNVHMVLKDITVDIAPGV